MNKKTQPFNFIQILFFLISLAYPALIYFGVQRVGFGVIFSGLTVLVLLKIFLTKPNKSKGRLQKLGALILILLAAVSFVSGDKKFLQLYPLVVNTSFFVLFTSSLFKSQNIVETFARIKEPLLPKRAVLYTRRVTMVWSAFFLINAMIVIYTIYFSTFEFWAFYNGFLSYIFIGSLFSLEFIVRTYVKKKWASQNV